MRAAELEIELVGEGLEIDIGGVDFYLVDLRGAIMSRNQYEYAASSGAILHDSRVT